jgi:acyl-CoA synthetase (AMP-forming)/AMP-acid ligase II
MDAKGYLRYAGRSPAKQLIKSGGENVYPAEVERALLAHEAVAAAVVTGVPDPQWGESVRAICELAPGRFVSEQDLIEFVGARIARYKRPRQIVFVTSLPRTPAGAIDRPAIVALHGAT